MHHAEPRRRVVTRDWQARCKACGWLGPIRNTKSLADEDAAIHDISENQE